MHEKLYARLFTQVPKKAILLKKKLIIIILPVKQAIILEI
jgi:hypothetical protein